MCECCNMTSDCEFGDSSIFNLRFNFGQLGEFVLDGTLWRAVESREVLNISFAEQDYEIKINYCPMCGRKLKGAEENV